MRLKYCFGVHRKGRKYVVTVGANYEELGQFKSPAEVYAAIGDWADNLE